MPELYDVVCEAWEGTRWPVTLQWHLEVQRVRVVEGSSRCVQESVYEIRAVRSSL